MHVQSMCIRLDMYAHVQESGVIGMRAKEIKARFEGFKGGFAGGFKLQEDMALYS